MLPGPEHGEVSKDPSIVEPLERLPGLEARIIELPRDDAGFRRGNAGLRAEDADLRARLGQESSGSSRPPSSNGLAKPAPESWEYGNPH
ncbi:hypothetical protein GCM10009779_02560 [Polymorphospora rubra]|uniref:Uncharacterized protein n=1 Tax=Polymorphospora rubra TaxID=338584 RepID=A0A810MWW4_9ACTN|nr:hypothetical protein Prubr_27220 [Polymorphospora rubra]